MFNFFKNIFGSLLNMKSKKLSNKGNGHFSNHNRIDVEQNNSGFIAGHDLHVHSQPQSSWIEKQKVITDVKHHFENFLTLAKTINTNIPKCLNTIGHCKKRLEREFSYEQIRHLDDPHQKEIYQILITLLDLESPSECDENFIKKIQKKLETITSYYDSP